MEITGMRSTDNKLELSEYLSLKPSGSAHPDDADSVGAEIELGFFDAFLEAFAETVSRTVEEHHVKECLGDVSVLERWSLGRHL